MRIQVMSDLHREFGFMDIRIDLADVLVLAGETERSSTWKCRD